MAETDPRDDTNPPLRRASQLPIAKPHITNVVCGSNLNCMFDLRHVAQCARNVSHNPKRFPAAVMRLREPKATGLIFESGKLQVLGTKSIDQARLASRKFARMLQKLGYRTRMDGFKVQNIVGHADTKLVIRLEGLHVAHYDHCNFEPEIFPALVYTLRQPRMKALVFAKGKIIFIGAKDKDDLDRAMEVMYPVLLSFRRT